MICFLNKTAATISGLVLSLALFATTTNAADLALKTEEYPPANFTNKDGELTGIATEMVRRTAEEAGVSISIESLPFKRGYMIVQDKPDTCFFGLWRTQAREDEFTWVGPLLQDGYALFGAADADIALDTLEDSFDYEIGAVAGWGSTEALRAAGHPKMQIVSRDELNLRKLKLERIDLWLSGILSAPYKAAAEGVAVKQVLAVKKVALSIACHKDTDKTTLEKMQKALDNIKSKGVVEDLNHKFM